jgi:hypothetical protein
MIRFDVLGLALVSMLVPSICLAQTMESTESDFRLPPFAAQSVAGEAVVDLADFVTEYLSETGAVPDMAQVVTADGNARTLSAVEVFALLARTTHLWRFTGGLPETVPIAPDEIAPPVLDAEDVIAPVEDQELGREVMTESFLSTVPAVVRWIDRLQVVPTAVYVEGERLSGADYLAGLAICISYAYWEGQLYETLFLPPYGPPLAWIAEEDAYYYVPAYETEGWDEPGGEGEGYWEEEWASEPASRGATRPLTGTAPPLLAQSGSIRGPGRQLCGAAGAIRHLHARCAQRGHPELPALQLSVGYSSAGAGHPHGTSAGAWRGRQGARRSDDGLPGRGGRD